MLGLHWLGLIACTHASSQIVDDPCALSALPVEGPLSAEAAKATSPVELAEVRIKEARLTSDPGFDELAELSLRCALVRDPASVEARRWLGYIEIQFHRFADAETRMAALYAETHFWRDALILGDARMEQGELDEAAAAYDDAMQGRPDLETYDRAAHLAWLRGDLDQAIELEERAVSAASPSDPEPMAWVLTRAGVLKSLRGERPDEIGLALQIVPHYRSAELALGRWFLASGDPTHAEPHLRAAGPTIEAVRALHEIDPTASVEAVKTQDRRGWAMWLATTDPAAALPLLDAELQQRHDAVTAIDRAWVAHRTGLDTSAQVREALATGIREPGSLLLAGEVTGDPVLAHRALEESNGLLPSEQSRAKAILGSALTEAP